MTTLPFGKAQYVNGTLVHVPPSDPASFPEWVKSMLDLSMTFGAFGITVLVTPDLAAHLLENEREDRREGPNEDNRDLKTWLVKKIQTDIESGKWQLNGESIIIAFGDKPSVPYYLNDGQHRLWSIVNSDIACPVVVVFGVDRNTRDTIDSGGKRSVSDKVKMDRRISKDARKHNRTLSTVAKMKLQYDADPNHMAKSIFDDPTDMQQVELARDEAFQKKVVTAIEAIPPGPLARHHRTALTFAQLILYDVAPERAAGFFAALFDKNNRRTSRVLRMFYQKAIANGLGKDNVGKVAMIFQTFNSWGRDEEGYDWVIPGRIPAIIR